MFLFRLFLWLSHTNFEIDWPLWQVVHRVVCSCLLFSSWGGNSENFLDLLFDFHSNYTCLCKDKLVRVHWFYKFFYFTDMLMQIYHFNYKIIFSAGISIFCKKWTNLTVSTLYLSLYPMMSQHSFCTTSKYPKYR